MTDTNDYPVAGNIDFRIEQGLVDVLKNNSTITAVFGSPSAVNIRRLKDKKTGTRSLPAIAVECLPEQTLPRTNEYHGRVEVVCVTQADSDADSQKVQALTAAVRDALHEDTPTGTAKHFVGDCGGFLIRLNKTMRGVVIHQIHEGATNPDDQGRTRRLVMSIDVWGYPGRVS